MTDGNESGAGWSAELEGADPTGRTGVFTPEVLDESVIAIPLLRDLDQEERQRAAADQAGRDAGDYLLHDVVIELNLTYGNGWEQARGRAQELVHEAVETASTPVNRAAQQAQGLDDETPVEGGQYLYARLEAPVLRELARLVTADGGDDGASSAADPDAFRRRRCVHRIWKDFPLVPLINRSVSTVKASAARIAFSAYGQEIVWAVVDSGIQGDHPHFQAHQNLVLPSPLQHRDFVTRTFGQSALQDGFGHGTHVAGIIAGGATRAGNDDHPLTAVTRYRDERGNVAHRVVEFDELTGMAPKCKLLSLKVLDENGQGASSRLLAALQYVNRINAYGRRLRIHGVNLSVGYDFEPEWFACGQSLVCVEVDHLVRSGVVVVAAAGNTGYGFHKSGFGPRSVASGVALTINDPGNAEEAITVGSTHRYMPHVYGVSYFSSKGPTGDGRLKPDLVAPGEKILSCAAGRKRVAAGGQDHLYVEDTGTSMAAPHVSGVIAAFLSVREEYVGRPDAVKQIFLDTATDLRRERSFQGRGLVDLMRAIQSV